MQAVPLLAQNPRDVTGLGFAGVIPERLIFQTPKVITNSAYNN